jgi:hypothetical protein
VSQVPQVLSSQIEQQIAQTQRGAQAGRRRQAARRGAEAAAGGDEAAVEPARIQAETVSAQAKLTEAEAKRITAAADLARAQAEAAAAPDLARASTMKADTEHMTAQIGLLNAHQAAMLSAAEAEGRALNGNESALEVWRATLESETKIRVAEIMAEGQARRAQARQTNPKETPQ